MVLALIISHIFLDFTLGEGVNLHVMTVILALCLDIVLCSRQNHEPCYPIWNRNNRVFNLNINKNKNYKPDEWSKMRTEQSKTEKTGMEI